MSCFYYDDSILTHTEMMVANGIFDFALSNLNMLGSFIMSERISSFLDFILIKVKVAYFMKCNICNGVYHEKIYITTNE